MARAFGGQTFLAPIGMHQAVDARCAVFATLQPPRRTHTPLGQQGNGCFGEQFILANQPIPAMIEPTPAAATPNGVAHHAEGVGAFQRFNRRVACVGHVGMHGGQPIGGWRSTHAARQRLVVGEGRTIGSDAANRDVVHRALRGGGNTVGQGLRQRPQHNIHNALAGFDIAPRNGGGWAGVDQRSFGGVHMQRRKTAGVHGHIVAHQATHHIGARRFGDAEHSIERTAHLRRCARKVERDGLACNRHSHANGQQVQTPIFHMLDDIFKRVATSRPGTKRGACAAFAVRLQVLGIRQHFLTPMRRRQLAQTALAREMRGALGGKVATAFIRGAHIAQNEPQHRFVEHAALVQLQRGDNQPFLVEFRRKRERARRHAPHVGMVGAAGDEKIGGLALQKHGRNHGDIGQVSAAGKRVVQDDEVARLPGGDRRQRGSDAIGHCAQVHGNVGGLRHHTPVGVENGA
ncbi:hypothetical protein ARMA_2115 [Ardenticatena maritima]|uniref:Uncharacterized protein n=1 Tax=Ardenticatena maritima TaxID=872965 RepID=A0A0M8K9V0_9CHLR|nr:hypothetical protein ARMA_2115 [Ardenticatena maritima]